MALRELSHEVEATSTTTIFFIIIALGLTYCAAIVIYRLKFHPLAKYPGPFWAKITDWHQVYHAWKGDRHIEFWRGHEKYGNFVRYGPNKLSINSASALKEIYGRHRANVKKSDFYTVFPATKDTYSTHSSIDKHMHAQKRRVLSHAFSDKAMHSMEKYVLTNIRIFCDGLAAQTKGAGKDDWSPGQNMADWCNYLAFDVMGDLCFGKAFGMLQKEENRFAIDLVSSASHRHLICGSMPLIHQTHLDKLLFHKISSKRERYMAYSKKQTAERTRLGDDSDRRDFFHYLLAARDPETGAGFGTSELWGESNLLIIAGSDTSSIAMAATYFYLVHSPAALRRAAAEVRAAFADVEEIAPHGARLGECAYLRACVDEALRLSPPVGGLLPREVLRGGLDVDGAHVPAGCVVGTAAYAVHRNRAHFPSPEAFVPERWIVGAAAPAGSGVRTDAAGVAAAQAAFCPFSIGPRGCIGKGMAYAEVTTAVARALFLFDLRLAAGSTLGEGAEHLEWGRRERGVYQLKDTFTSVKDGPMVEVRRRQD